MRIRLNEAVMLSLPLFELPAQRLEPCFNHVFAVAQAVAVDKTLIFFKALHVF